ncbi:MAG: flagellar hook-associated protein FlgK [Proteobacteria bacterium]|nr:flagellar hook-associated protein FlgK [Pseudomonadota bacterium]
MASSLTQALRTAQSGLLVNQAALNAVANNIANVNTKGYSRKTVNFEQRVVDGAGAGVQLSELTRQIDEGLLKSLRLELSNFSSLDVQRSFYDRLQDLFGAPADNASISHIVSDFTAALESLAIAPNKTLELSEVLRQAQNTTLKLQAMSTTIQELRQQADNSIANIVTEINTLVTRIGEFNDTLVRNSATNRDVTDLKDQRDQALDRLAELIDIRYFVRGDGDVVVFTSDGRTLVDNIPATLTHRAASTVSATSSHNEGNIGGIFVGTEIAGNDITNEIKSGQLKGLIELRDSVLPDLQIQIDEMAAQIRDTFNQIHNSGAPYPGMQSMTGSRTFVSPSTQTMTLDPTNGADDVTIALFDSNGDQKAATTLDTIMTSAIYGSGAQNSHGAWTITEVAATLQDWLRANGASAATASVNSAGKFSIELNAPSLNLAFRDETESADGSARGDAVIGFNSGGLPQVTIAGTVETGDTYSVTINGTKVTYTVGGGDTTLADVRNGLFAAINANGTINTVVTAAAGTNDGEITITADTAGATFTITASATNNGVSADNSAVVTPGGGIDETVSGFSYFLGLNDFFVDGLPENIHQTDVLASAFLTTAATLTFNDSTGVLTGSPLAIAAGSSLSTIATLITNNVTNVTAKVVPDGSGVRLRISHDKGIDLVLTQASGDTLLTDMGMHVADVRVASVLAVRSDIIATPSRMSRGAMQWNADLGAAGEYFRSVGDDTVINDLAEKLNSTVAFKQAGGLSDTTTTFGEYASSILARNASLSNTNKINRELQKSLADSLQLKSDNVRGVNLDEEMSQLILFEQAYIAAARIITVVQNMFDALDRAIG